MTTATTTAQAAPLAEVSTRQRSEWSRAWRRFKRYRPGLVGLVMLVGLTILAIAPGLFAPYSPYDITSSLRGLPPSSANPFGMDEVGRDVFSRVIHGARIAMMVGLASTGLSLVIGVLVGAIAGYYGGWIDNVLMRFVDALMAFPIIVLLIAIAAAIGPSLQNLIVILGATVWARYARVVRADVLSLREREFVMAARTIGVPNYRILLRHIIPNEVGPIIVLASLSVAGNILAEATLSFLGLGAQPPEPAWGSMLSAGRTYIMTYPHIALFPGIAIALTVLAFNLVGDGLRDALDPRTQG